MGVERGITGEGTSVVWCTRACGKLVVLTLSKLSTLVMIIRVGKEAVTLKVLMRLTVFHSKPSSFSGHKEFLNAMAALLYYPPPHLLRVRLLWVCALATSVTLWSIC